MSIMLAFPAALVVVLTMWVWSNAKGNFRSRTNKLFSFYGKILVGLILLVVYSVLFFGSDAVGETIVMFL